MVVYFAFLLHIYQPPVQIAPVVKQIVKESYRPLLNALRDHPAAKISLNINATLTEQLDDYGYRDIIEGIATLASVGKLILPGQENFILFYHLSQIQKSSAKSSSIMRPIKNISAKSINPGGSFRRRWQLAKKSFLLSRDWGLIGLYHQELLIHFQNFPPHLFLNIQKLGLIWFFGMIIFQLIVLSISE